MRLVAQGETVLCAFAERASSRAGARMVGMEVEVGLWLLR